MAGNNIQGSLTITTTAAQSSLRAAAKAMQAVATAGEEVTAQQRLATKNMQDYAAKIVSENRKAADSYAQITQAAIKQDAQLRQLDLNGKNSRSLSRDQSAANIETQQALTLQKEQLSNARVLTEEGKQTLAGAKSQTEEIRQQTMLQESQAKIMSTQLRDQIALAQAVQSQQEKVNGQQLAGSFNSSQLRYALYDVSQSFQAIGIAALGASTAVLGVGVAWEKEFSNVARTLNTQGQSTEMAALSVKQLQGQLITLVDTMPVDWASITNIATLANQLGIGSKYVGAFTKTVAEFSAVTGVSVDDTATAFGRLNSLVPDVDNNFQGLGDSIAKVGVTSAATEGQIINIATQLSSVVGQAGFTSKQIVGLSGALASIAVPPELARGTMTRVFGDIGRAVNSGGAQLQNFAAVSGMSADSFKAAWQSGQGAEVFQNFVAGIHADGTDAESVIRSLGITSVRDVPILIRLANAADSAGTSGNLLAEAMDNANNSAGELDRQYSIISKTISSQVQVLGNNVQSVFARIGQTNFGSFSDALQTITHGIQDFGRTLNDNAELFGAFKLPFTNAEALGAAAVITGITGAFALLVSMLGRVAAGGIAIAQVVDRVKTHFDSASTSVSVTSREMAGLQAQFGKSSPIVAAASQEVRVAAQAADTAALSYKGFGSQASGISGVLSKVQGGFNKASDAVGTLARNFGPEILGAAVIAGIGAITAADKAARDLGSTTDQTVQALDKMGSATTTLSNIQINKSGWLSAVGAIGPNLQSAFSDVTTLNKGLENLGSGGFWKDANEKFLDVGRTISGDGATWDAASQLVDKLNNAFGQMVDAGNLDGAIKGFSQFTTSANLSDDAILNILAHADRLKGGLDDELLALNVDDTNDNLIKLARGTLPEYNDALDNTLNTTAGTAQAFSDAGSDVTEFTTTVTQSIGGLVDIPGAYGDAVTKANDAAKQSWVDAGNDVSDFVEVTSVSFDQYLDELDSQIAAQQAFSSNLVKVILKGGPDVAEAASQLSPQLLQGLVDGDDNAFNRWKADVGTQSADALSTIAANIASISPDVAARIATLGTDAQASFWASLVSGNFSVDDLLQQYGLADADGNPVKVYADFNPLVDPSAQADVNGELNNLAKPDYKPREAPYNPLVDPSAQADVDGTLNNLAAPNYAPRTATMAPNVDGGAAWGTQAWLDQIAGQRQPTYIPGINNYDYSNVEGSLNYLARDRDVNITANIDQVNGQIIDSATYSSGGDVKYLASGGTGFNVGLFKPRGTDTVPAMLTPGEFVMKRSAAQFYGPDIMNAMNNKAIDFANVSRPVPAVSSSRGGGGGSDIQLVELVASDKALLARAGMSQPTIFAPSDVSAAANKGNTSNFKKGNR